MMNIVQTQDQLKNFSQEQLIKEMQMPSGSAPQFLILNEIMRRQKMQQDFAAQQGGAPQTTVAEDAIAAAGVPQEGLAGMAQALAPQTDMMQNTGVGAVQQMYAGGPVKKMAEGDVVVRDGLQYVEGPDGTLRLKEFQGLQRILQGVSGARESIGSPAAGGAVNETPSFPSLQERVPSLFRAGDTSDVAPILEEDFGESSGPGFAFDLRGLGPNNQAMTDFQEYTGVEDTGPSPGILERIGLGPAIEKIRQNRPAAPEQDEDTKKLDALRILRETDEKTGVPTEPTKPQTPEVPVAPQGGGAGAGGAGGAGGMSSFEQELMDTLARREKAAEQDKWLALAQVGLNMMSSTQPTLLGAVGEAGLKGVEAARGARDQYEKDRMELLGAMEQSRLARAAAAASAARGAQGDGMTALQAINLQRNMRKDLFDELSTVQDAISIIAPMGIPTDSRNTDRLLRLEAYRDQLTNQLFGSTAVDTNTGTMDLTTQ